MRKVIVNTTPLVAICKKQVDASLDWIHVEKIENQMAKSMFKTQLHDGEVEVMILAKEKMQIL